MARPRDPEILERIARGAMRLFTRKGFEQTRMSDVAREVGVSSGTLYNYVESKQALFYLLVDWGMGDGPPELPERLPLKSPPVDAVVQRLRERVGTDFDLERLDRALMKPVPGNPREELRAVVGEFFDRTAETRKPVDVLESSAPDLPEELGEFFYAVRRSVFDRFARYLEARVEAGDFADVGAPELLARHLVESVTYAARCRHRDPDASTVAERDFREATVGLWVNALVPADAGGADA